MNDIQRKILEMLADKKISIEEAERLLSILQTDTGTEKKECRENN